MLYVLNNYRFPKWYYGYESGATKSQRERKHHLRVYVLRVGQPCGGGGARLATVLDRHASPSFTIASYRRANRSKKSSGISDDGAGSSVRAGGRQRGESSSSDTSSSERDESTTALERELSYPSVSRQVDLPGSQERDDLQHESHDSAEGILLGLRYSSSHTPDPAPVVLDGLSRQPSGGDSRVHRVVDEKLFWRQTRLAPTLARARELAVLQYFVTHAPLDELWGPVLSLENRLWQSWIEPLHRETRDARSRALLQRFCLPAAGAHDPRQHSRDALGLLSVHSALALCAEVAVELVTSRELRDLLRIALQSANEGEQGAGGEAAGGSATATALPTASDHSRKSETRERFAALVDGVHAHVSVLVTRSRRRSVGELVDELVTLVHQSQRLRWLQPAMRELLGAETPDRAAFEAFCAQWREAYMVRHGSPATRTRMVSVEIRSGGGKPPGRWSRRWLLDARSLRVSGQHQQQHGGDPRSSPAYGMSAWELLSTVQQFGAVDVEVDTSASLRVRAALDGAVLLNEDRDGASCSQPMHLRLDGKYRIFRAFPSGVATMAVARGGWVFGDYFGHLESAVSIKVWAFAYQSEEGGEDGKRPHSSGVARGAPTLVRCIAVHMRLQAPLDASTLLPDSSESGGDEADRLVVAVKVDEAKSGPRGGGLEHEPSVRRGDVAPDLRFLSGAERHELWKTLHWRTRSEFEVEYQQVSS